VFRTGYNLEDCNTTLFQNAPPFQFRTGTNLEDYNTTRSVATFRTGEDFEDCNTKYKRTATLPNSSIGKKVLH